MLRKANLKKSYAAEFEVVLPLHADVPMPVGLIDLRSEIREDNLTLKWNAPCDNGARIKHYMVYRRVVSEDGGETAWSPLIRVPANQQLEYEDTRLETGKTYEFVVTATNICGEAPKVQESIKRVKVSIGKEVNMGYICVCGSRPMASSPH